MKTLTLAALIASTLLISACDQAAEVSESEKISSEEMMHGTIEIGDETAKKLSNASTTLANELIDTSNEAANTIIKNTAVSVNETVESSQVYTNDTVENSSALFEESTDSEITRKAKEMVAEAMEESDFMAD